MNVWMGKINAITRPAISSMGKQIKVYCKFVALKKKMHGLSTYIFSVELYRSAANLYIEFKVHYTFLNTIAFNWLELVYVVYYDELFY